MEDPQWPMCNSSLKIFNQMLEEVAKLKSSQNVQHWAAMAKNLITNWQMEARTMLVQAFKKRHDPSHWRSIVEKLSRKYLCKPFQIIYRQKRQVQYHHQV